MTVALALRVLLVPAMLAVPAAEPRQASDVAQPGATVTGAVTDDLGQPVPFARVGLIREPWDLVRVSRADAGGRFVLAGAPPGAYRLLASKTGYVELPWDEIPPSAMAVLDAGAAVEVALVLPRGASIEGVVRFDDGTPAPGTRVFAITWLRGARRTARLNPRMPYTTTNSRGEYRLAGLAAGDYVVEARPDNRQMLQTSLAFGDSESAVTLPVQFYPGVATEAEAAPIALAVADRRAGVDVVLTPEPVTDVTLHLDLPAGVTVTEVSASCHAPDAAHGLTFGYPQVDRRARQVVCPGMVRGAHEVFVSAAVRPDGADRSARRYLSGAATVVVADRPLAATIVMDLGPTLTGRVEWSGAGVAPPLPTLALELEPLDRDPKDVRTLRWEPDPRGVVEATDLPPGRYVIRDSSGDGRMLVGATIAGRDVLDAPFEVTRGMDIAGVVLSFSSDVTSLAGTVVDAGGQPVIGRHVGVFPAEPSRWDTMSRRHQTTATDASGGYRFDRLPAGEYFLTMAPEVRWGMVAEPGELERLTASAARVSVGPTGETRFDVRVDGSRLW